MNPSFAPLSNPQQQIPAIIFRSRTIQPCNQFHVACVLMWERTQDRLGSVHRSYTVLDRADCTLHNEGREKINSTRLHFVTSMVPVDRNGSQNDRLQDTKSRRLCHKHLHWQLYQFTSILVVCLQPSIPVVCFRVDIIFALYLLSILWIELKVFCRRLCNDSR